MKEARLGAREPSIPSAERPEKRCPNQYRHERAERPPGSAGRAKLGDHVGAPRF